jgi:hypothetical protein
MTEELRAKFNALIKKMEATANDYRQKAEDHEDRSAEETSAY